MLEKVGKLKVFQLFRSEKLENLLFSQHFLADGPWMPWSWPGTLGLETSKIVGKLEKHNKSWKMLEN